MMFLRWFLSTHPLSAGWLFVALRVLLQIGTRAEAPEEAAAN
jgi:hypothetical protein